MPHFRTLLLITSILLLQKNIYASHKEADSIAFFEIEFKLFPILLNNPDSALQLIELQDDIISDNSSKRMRSRLQNNYGAYHWISGRLDLALEHFFASLKYAEEGNLMGRIGSACNNIAIIYNDLEDYEQCLFYNRKSLDISKQMKSPRDQLITYNNLGSVYEKMDSLDLAWAYLDSSIQLQNIEPNESVLCLSWMNKGSIAFQRQQIDTAQFYSQKSLDLSLQIRDKKSQVHSLLVLGKTALAKEHENLALQHAEMALKVSQEIDFLEGMQEAYLLYSNIYGQLGQEVNRLEFLQLSNELRDSIFNKKTAQHIARLERAKESEAHERQLTEKELAMNKMEALKERDRWIYVVSFISGLVIIVLLILLFQHYKHIALKRSRDLLLTRFKKKLVEDELKESFKENEALNEALRKKEMELLEYVVVLEKKQKLVADIQEQISQLQENSAELLRLKRLMASSQTNTADWDEFIIRFEKVHERFFERLNQYAQKLTPTDLKICAFLRMNLSSKQIAQLLNIESGSVDMARHRLRKNLNLSKEDNLTAFINQI